MYITWTCFCDVFEFLILLHISLISGLTRDNEAAQKLFTENDGFSVLMRAMQTNIEKLKIKAAFLLSSFVVDKPQYKG